MRSRGPRLGELLEHDGVLTREQLLRALRNQKVVGGKLGTCLLEIDALPEEVLVRSLAAQQNAEAATPEELRGIADEVLSLVPAKLARAHFLIPFRATATQIEIAMIDARDLQALDELSFVTGRRVRPFVASEVRILEALEKYYGMECPTRFVKLLDRMNRSRFLWRSHEESPRRELLQWDSSLGIRPAGGGEEPHPIDTLPLLVPPPAAEERPETTQPISAAQRAAAAGGRKTGRKAKGTSTVELPAAVASAPPPDALEKTQPGTLDPLALARAAERRSSDAARRAAPDSALDLAGAEQRLLDPSTADDVGRVLVDFAASRTALCLLFQVRRVEVEGWMAHGVEASRLRALRVRLDRPSLFVALREGSAFHRGPLQDLAGHEALRALLGELGARELVVLPLRVRNRLVGALLAVPKAASYPAPELAELKRVVALAAHALELCVLRQKLRKA